MSDSQSQPINWAEVLEGFKGRTNLVRVVVDAALKELPRLLESIDKAIAARDVAGLRLAAHTLKGSVRYLGKTQAHAIALQLEQLASQADFDAAARTFQELKVEMARLMDAMAAYQARDYQH